MIQPKPTVPAMRVLRISAHSPMGEWVDKVAPVAPGPGKDLPEVAYGTWMRSSYDLLDGVDATEDPDTIPGGLVDELFAPKQDAAKSAGE
jgi:hypothetical protein